MTDDQTKRCTKCGEVKPIAAFSKDSRHSDGLRCSCRACDAEHRRRYYAANADKFRQYASQYRAENPDKVRECKRQHRTKNLDKVREYDRQRRADPAVREAQREYWRRRRTDPVYVESQREYRRQRYADPAVREAQREHNRQYRDKNADVLREYDRRRRADPTNREKQREYNHWYKRTPEGQAATRAAWHARRARERNAPGRGVTAADIRTIAAGQTDRKGRLRCWWCGNPIEGTPHLDHRISLKHGGAHDPANCCLSCEDCNLKKQSHGPEWAGRLV